MTFAADQHDCLAVDCATGQAGSIQALPPGDDRELCGTGQLVVRLARHALWPVQRDPRGRVKQLPAVILEVHCWLGLAEWCRYLAGDRPSHVDLDVTDLGMDLCV